MLTSGPGSFQVTLQRLLATLDGVCRRSVPGTLLCVTGKAVFLIVPSQMKTFLPFLWHHLVTLRFLIRNSFVSRCGCKEEQHCQHSFTRRVGSVCHLPTFSTKPDDGLAASPDTSLVRPPCGSSGPRTDKATAYRRSYRSLFLSALGIYFAVLVHVPLACWGAVTYPGDRNFFHAALTWGSGTYAILGFLINGSFLLQAVAGIRLKRRLATDRGAGTGDTPFQHLDHVGKVGPRSSWPNLRSSQLAVASPKFRPIYIETEVHQEVERDALWPSSAAIESPTVNNDPGLSSGSVSSSRKAVASFVVLDGDGDEHDVAADSAGPRPPPKALRRSPSLERSVRSVRGRASMELGSTWRDKRDP